MKRRPRQTASTSLIDFSLTRRIDLASLQMFVTICEELNLTRAAERENIAPSAMSKRLADLEAALGAELFIRHPRGMRLTDAGASLLHHARAILLSVAKMGNELNEYAKGIRGHIRMLANLSAIVQFLPEDLSSFFAMHELLRIDLEERFSAAVVKGIEEGIGELGICVADADSRALSTLPYHNDRLVLAVQRGHPLAGSRDIEFADTLDFDHIGLHQDSAIYIHSCVAAVQRGREVKLRIHVPGFDAACRMVESGLGVALVPDRAFALLARGMNVECVSLTDAWAQRKLKIVFRDPNGLSQPARLIIDHLVARAVHTAASSISP